MSRFIVQHSVRRYFCFLSKSHQFALNISFTHKFKVDARFKPGLIVTHPLRLYSVSPSMTNINLRNEPLARYVRKIQDEYNRCLVDRNAVLTVETDRGKVEKVIALMKTFRDLESNINSLREIRNDCKEEDEFSDSVESEIEINEKELINIEEELVDVLLPVDEDELCSEMVMEIMPGVGGQESSLFANELFVLYRNYLKFTGWDVELIEREENSIGGIKNAILTVSGLNSFKYLRFEGGVHQVQRVPKTERGGRMHTSTVSVAVYPRPSEVDVTIKDEELEWEAKTSRGPGGQHANKIQSAVRLTHLPTGIIIECQVSRSHNENRKIALQRLRLKLFQIESDKHLSSIQSTRKAQMKNKCRNEKARTYNFPQNRITDHRYKKTINNIPKFFEGGEYFHDFLEEILVLHRVGREQKFLEFLKNME